MAKTPSPRRLSPSRWRQQSGSSCSRCLNSRSTEPFHRLRIWLSASELLLTHTGTDVGGWVGGRRRFEVEEPLLSALSMCMHNHIA